MSKSWLVFKYEYLRQVLRRRFLVAAFSIPLFLGVVIAASILSAVAQGNNSPVGYVDPAGIIKTQPQASANPIPFNQPVKFIAFADESQARAALDDRSIQAYYVVLTTYLQDARVKVVAYKQPSSGIEGQFSDLLRTNLLSELPAPVSHRLISGDTILVQSADGGRQMASSDWFNIVIPIFAAIMMMMVVMTTGSYLLQALVEERENRTIELMVTSLSPDQLMAGKTLGNLAVGLTQILVWLVMLLIAVVVGGTRLDLLSRLSVSSSYLIIVIATLIPSFIMIAGLMATLGSTFAEAREAQQFSGLFTLPMVLPLWFSYSIMISPNGPLATALSFFPLTAPVTLSMRAGFTDIPVWQLVAILFELSVLAAGSIWLAARAFRIGALSYGKRVSLGQIFRRRSMQLAN